MRRIDEPGPLIAEGSRTTACGNRNTSAGALPGKFREAIPANFRLLFRWGPRACSDGAPRVGNVGVGLAFQVPRTIPGDSMSNSRSFVGLLHRMSKTEPRHDASVNGTARPPATPDPPADRTPDPDGDAAPESPAEPLEGLLFHSDAPIPLRRGEVITLDTGPTPALDHQFDYQPGAPLPHRGARWTTGPQPVQPGRSELPGRPAPPAPPPLVPSRPTGRTRPPNRARPTSPAGPTSQAGPTSPADPTSQTRPEPQTHRITDAREATAV